MAMESDKTRALRIVRNAELVHPGLPLVEAFLNDAVDGTRLQDICCKHTPITGVMQTSHDFVKDWKDLVRLCKFYPQN